LKAFEDADPQTFSLPVVSAALQQATPLGVMRWVASRPLNHPLPAELQWCPTSAVGFCGDWIEGTAAHDQWTEWH
tara:strand:+ start:2218 stop:2442 length:225 start_codon:yes stop_codon:yes gene_type:complete